METNCNAIIGTGVALVTPFTSNNDIDFAALEKLLAHVSPHVDYLVVNGTTAESATLNAEEKYAVLNFVKANNPRKLPIMFGIGGNDTDLIIKKIHETDFTGIHSILSVTPYYNRPNQEGLYQHYIKIADNAPVPILLYNVPTRTGCNMAAETTLRLAEHPNIIGIKESTADILQMIKIAKEKPENFLLICGDDLTSLAMISMGGQGAVSVIANATPKEFGLMVKNALANNYAEAQKYLYQISELDKLLFKEGNPVGVKVALKLLGIGNAKVRLPLVEASPSLYKEIQDELVMMKYIN